MHGGDGFLDLPIPQDSAAFPVFHKKEHKTTILI
jgi:hypothetical protein